MSMAPITLSQAESAGVTFGGAFAGALATGVPVVQALIVGAVALFAALGYHGYKAATA